MPSIDTSDCWLALGVGPRFKRSLVWHFARFLREHMPEPKGIMTGAAAVIDLEARRMTEYFVTDMLSYFQKTLYDTYQDLESLSPEGILELYLEENLEDFEHHYESEYLPAFRVIYDRQSLGAYPVGIVSLPESRASEAALCH